MKILPYSPTFLLFFTVALSSPAAFGQAAENPLDFPTQGPGGPPPPGSQPPILPPGSLPPAASEVTYIGRLGLFSGPEFTRSSDNYQYSGVYSLTNSGYASGNSNRYNGASSAGFAAWVANAATGTTTRVGFFSGAEFTRSLGSYQASSVSSLTESGYAYGGSTRYNGATEVGQAAWVANAATGITTRVGLYSGPEFTYSSNNLQFSYVSSLMESGYARGVSYRYNSAGNLGEAAWVANAATGTTTRVGLFSGAEFTKSDGSQYSTASSLTESGYAGGYSTRYNGATEVGRAAWVANAATGTTTRVGLFSGTEFTRSTDNYQYSGVSFLTNSGYASGSSTRYNGAGNVGDAAWVANAATGLTTRVGLFSGAEFTKSDGSQSSGVTSLTESGYASGSSSRFNGAADAGRAAWVANATTGTTTRVGLSGAEFTRSTDNYQYSTASSLTESGYAGGYSNRFNGAAEVGRAAWVANAATGTTTRVGLFSGTEFTSTSGNYQYSIISSLTKSGYAGGYSSRYNGANDAGQAAWVVNAAPGTTTRVGLSGAEFTRSTDNYQYSSVSSLTESGYARGVSSRFNGANEAGQAAWVANVSTGLTTRVGETDSVHTSNDGYQYSSVTVLLESGDALGLSYRYNGNATQDGQTAWIYQQVAGLQTDFVLSTRPSDGYAYSSLTGMTLEGLAYGYYTLFSGETNLGNRAFVWSEDTGVMTLDEEISGGVAQYGWQNFLQAAYANGDGYVVGLGSLASGGQGVFLAQIPEPSALLTSAMGGLLLLFRRRTGRGA